jgi:hypothetical protein
MKIRSFYQNFIYWMSLLVAIYFFLLFSGHFLSLLDFWSLFASGLMVFLMAALWLDPLFSKLISGDFREKTVQRIFLGVGSGLLLYGVCFIGNFLLRRVFPEAVEDLVSIYNLRVGSSTLRIGIFLALIIGPGEELLWRGFLQRYWSGKLGKWLGFLATSFLYSLVYLSTRNPVLVLAAMVCGLWWGYQYLKFNSLLANIISHLLWALLVFIILPFA